MKKTRYKRNGKTIHNLTTGKATGYAHVNEAKRASAALQKLGTGKLGDGRLQLITK